MVIRGRQFQACDVIPGCSRSIDFDSHPDELYTANSLGPEDIELPTVNPSLTCSHSLLSFCSLEPHSPYRSCSFSWPSLRLRLSRASQIRHLSWTNSSRHSRHSLRNRYRAIRLTPTLPPPLSARPPLWRCGIVEVRILPEIFSPLGGSAGTISEEWVLKRQLFLVVNCEANPNFNVTTADGDGNIVQYCTHVHRIMRFCFMAIRMLTRSIGYVGYDPDQDTVIVAHQGTDFNKT